jgi:hypothetical protein
LISELVLTHNLKKYFNGFESMKLSSDEFMEEGLHEKHEQKLTTWEPTQHLLKDRGKPRKAMSRWPVAGPSR